MQFFPYLVLRSMNITLQSQEFKEELNEVGDPDVEKTALTLEDEIILAVAKRNLSAKF